MGLRIVKIVSDIFIYGPNIGMDAMRGKIGGVRCNPAVTLSLCHFVTVHSITVHSITVITAILSP